MQVLQKVSVLIVVSMLLSSASCAALDGFTSLQGSYLSECFNGCKDYASLEEAAAACLPNTGCAGITLSKKSYVSAASNPANASNPLEGIWGYQLRANPIIAPSTAGESSWIKSSWLFATSSDSVCYQSVANAFSINCATDCKNYSYFQDAQAACNTTPSCNAITFTQGKYFQLRATGSSTHSTAGEMTWLKYNCGADFKATPCLAATSTPSFKKNIHKQTKLH